MNNADAQSIAKVISQAGMAISAHRIKERQYRESGNQAAATLALRMAEESRAKLAGMHAIVNVMCESDKSKILNELAVSDWF